jgi:hypothetical protein
MRNTESEARVAEMVEKVIKDAFSHEELQKINGLGLTLGPQPLDLPVNRHGHHVIRVLDPSLNKKTYTMGREEYNRLQESGVCVDDLVALTLLGKANTSYDDIHRLEMGWYNVALVPAYEVPDPGNIGQWHDLGRGYGYQMPQQAGIMPLLLPELTSIRMAQMGVDHVTTFHDPFEMECDGRQVAFVLGATHRGQYQALVANQNIGPEAFWKNQDVAIAFFDPDCKL